LQNFIYIGANHPKVLCKREIYVAFEAKILLEGPFLFGGWFVKMINMDKCVNGVAVLLSICFLLYCLGYADRSLVKKNRYICLLTYLF